TSPDLTTLRDHPERLASLRRQLPNLLVEATTSAPPQLGLAKSMLSLKEGPFQSGQASDAILLLTAPDLNFTGSWSVNAVPDPLGVERFDDLGVGVISVPIGLLRSAPDGSTVAWIEYGLDHGDP